MGGKKHRREKKYRKKRDPRGRRHLRGKTHGKRVVSTQREGPKKRKDQMGNNSRQDSSQKLRVKIEQKERKKVVKRREKIRQEQGHASIDHIFPIKSKNKMERKKESGKKKRENTVGIGACINRPSFPSLLANPLIDVPKSNSQQPFRPILQNAQL